MMDAPRAVRVVRPLPGIEGAFAGEHRLTLAPIRTEAH